MKTCLTTRLVSLLKNELKLDLSLRRATTSYIDAVAFSSVNTASSGKTCVVNMESFKRINWQCPLEFLLVNDVFIKDEKMREQSQMYKILNDNVVDPFENIEDDYAEVNIELLKRSCGDTHILDKEIENKKQCKQNKKLEKEKIKTKQVSKEKQKIIEQQEVTMKQESTEKSYIPGLRKLSVQFTKLSVLSTDQQAMCLKALLRLLNQEQMPISAEEKVELENYMALQNVITAEQKEFQELAKESWGNVVLKFIKCNKFLLSKWKEKYINVQKLPKHYTECANISFSSDKKFTINFVSCLQQSLLPKVIFPNIDRPYYFNVTDMELSQKYLSLPDKQKPHFKLPVSEDTFSENLAKRTKADLIISSSGLKCLLSNITSCHEKSWTIPIVIKSHNEKNVIYVDKKLPPVTSTIIEKNTWVYKYILRHYFVSNNDNDDDVLSGKSAKSDKSKLDTDLDNECSKSFNEYLKHYEEEMCSHSIASDPEEASLADKEQKNVSYSFFTIGPIDSVNDFNQCQLRKNISKEFQMLIRTKTDGDELLPNGQLKPIILAPKMEHQIAFGGEAITLEEGMQQWASLIFRPEASLARVRISSCSNELIQIERHTAVTLAAEIKRLYNVKVEDSLAVLYNLIERLSSLTPGQYIMRHTMHNGPFAYIYKETADTDSGKQVFDLNTIYQFAKFPTNPITPWPAIDPMVVTPALKYFNRMPAMFRPYEYNTRQHTVTTGKRFQNKTNMKKNQSPLRRSLREKKPRVWYS